MKRLLLVCTLAFGMGVAVEKFREPAQDDLSVTLPNSCLVVAREYEATLEARAMLNGLTWTRIVHVTYRCHWWSRRGHAYCVYALRNGDLYSYDTLHGSAKLNTRSHDIKDVVRALRDNDVRVGSGFYLD